LPTAADPCRNIRSSVEVAVPSPLSRQIDPIIANRPTNPNGEFPSIWDIP
jgi:hypothetical protein